MNRVMFGLLWLGVLVVLPTQAGTITITKNCDLCEVSGAIGEFGTTTINASAVTLPYQTGGSAEVTIDFQGYTAGPERPGFIYITASANSEAYGLAFIQVGDYHCSSHPLDTCGTISRQFLPFTLGTEFDIKLDSFFTTNNGVSGSADAYLQFSVYENVGLADGMFPFIGSRAVVSG